MGLYEDYQKQSKTSEGGLYQQYLKTQEPKQSTFSKVVDTTKSVGKNIVGMFTNPAPAQQEFERQVLPDYYQGDSKIMKYATAPGTAITRTGLKAISRLITPGLTPLTTDIAQIYEVSKKGGIADKVASGELPASTLDDFEVLKKTSPQIVGDVAQAVLTFYGGGAVKNVAQQGGKEGFKQAFKAGFKENAPLGLLFGSAGLASESDFSGVPKEDAMKIATTLGVSTFTAGILGGIVRGTIPATKTVQNRIAKTFEEKKIKIPVQSIQKETSNIKINTPKSLYADYRQKMGYEPYLKPEELPVIEMGPKATPSELPTIQIGQKTPTVKTEFKYEPITETTSAIIEKGKQAPELIQQAQRTPIESIQRPIPKQPDTTGTTFVPKISKEIEAQAIENKFVSKFGGLPEVQRMNLKEQSSKWADLVNNDYERAKRIVLGAENPPEDLKIGMGLEAVIERATKEGDWLLQKELATNPKAAPTQASYIAQNLKAFDNNLVDSTDPVELMQSVVKARERGAEVKVKKAKGETVKQIKDTIKKNLPKKEDWNSFISSIEC